MRFIIDLVRSQAFRRCQYIEQYEFCLFRCIRSSLTVTQKLQAMDVPTSITSDDDEARSFFASTYIKDYSVAG